MDARMPYRLGLWAIIVLVLLNVGLLGLFWYDHLRKPPRPSENRPGPDEFFVRELGLDKTQADSVRALRREHLLRTDPLRVEMVNLNRRMMDELFVASPDTALIRKLSEENGRKQAEFDRQVYQYFEQVKGLLRPEQRGKLHSLIIEALEKKLPGSEGTGNERPPNDGAEGRGRRNERRPPPPNDRNQPPPNGR